MGILLALLAAFGFTGGQASPVPPGDGGLQAAAGQPRACPDVRTRDGEATDVRVLTLSCADARQVIRDVEAGRLTFGLTCTASERSGQPGELAQVCSGSEQQVTWTQS